MKKKEKRKGLWITIILLIILAAGLYIFFYPAVSDQINRYRQDKIITDYKGSISRTDEETCQQMLREAEAYNRKLLRRSGRFEADEQEDAEYRSILNADRNGVMGYIEIPKIGLQLPIYHGATDRVLQDAIAHTEGSSLPVGGAGTHAVISGHTGMPSAKLFTDIDQLTRGDHFRIHILNRVLTYEVDQIRTVLPEGVDDLVIDPKEDYCTLVTCTPYGINTHRLLVRGTRVPDEGQEDTPADTPETDTLLRILFTAVPVMTAAVIILVILAVKRKRKDERSR